MTALSLGKSPLGLGEGWGQPGPEVGGPVRLRPGVGDWQGRSAVARKLEEARIVPRPCNNGYSIQCQVPISLKWGQTKRKRK